MLPLSVLFWSALAGAVPDSAALFASFCRRFSSCLAFFARSKEHDELLQKVCAVVQATEPRAQITCTIKEQYRNMRYWLEDDMTPVELARQACRELGIEPVSTPTRGGTDGSQLTARGVPTPNLFTGTQNAHGPLEFISVQDMVRATEVCLKLAELWANKG